MRRFNPDKELYKIQKGNKNKIIFGVMAMLLIISIGSTYALYQIRYSKKIIYTKVAPFSNRDIILTVLVDGKKQNDFPNKDEGYYFNGLDCETEDVTTATWDYNLWALNLTSTKPNKCNVLFGKEPAFLNERIKFLNEHKEGNSESLADDDSAKNIRYIGKDPNNYIWFNCDNYRNLTQETAEQKCEKWRIIGLFNNITKTIGGQENLVKIIRDDNIGSIAWGSSTNWATSSLQQSLNDTYYKGTALKDSKKGITEATRNMVEQITWNIGGTKESPGVITSQWYTYERGTTVPSGASSTWNGYIALMYPSDYGYASSGNSTTNRNTCLAKVLYEWWESPYVEDCAGNDWLWSTSNHQWTLTVSSSYANNIFCIATGGSITGSYAGNSTKLFDVRPSLYLKSNVRISDGTGTEDDPYILNP